MAGAVRAAAELGVWMVNIHAGGGRRMMTAAAEALQGFSSPPLLIGVTILTSLGQDDITEIGYVGSPAEEARERLKQLAALRQLPEMAGRFKKQ